MWLWVALIMTLLPGIPVALRMSSHALLDHGRRDADEIAREERDALIAERDDDGLRMQIVVYASRKARRIIARHGRAGQEG